MKSIQTPTLLISKSKVKANIKKMAAKAEMSGALFRPHFKTHQSIEVGDIIKEAGITKITVSSVEMANFFSKNGWHDITIAFPVNIREINEINNLASNINLNLLAESMEALSFLENNLNYAAGLFIKIDAGYHRTGLSADNLAIDKIISFLKTTTKLNFKGFLTHAGHTYHAKGKAETLDILKKAQSQLQSLKEKYKTLFPNTIISYGDTPSCSMADDCKGFDEIRPGNFVYNDVMQYHLGSCQLDDVAVAAACPVVAIHSERNEVVIYGGAVHLSKENIVADNNFKLYGYVVPITQDGWGKTIPGAYVTNLSQEHGIIKMPATQLAKIKIGDLLGVLPIHSCLTADLLKKQVFVE